MLATGLQLYLPREVLFASRTSATTLAFPMGLPAASERSALMRKSASWVMMRWEGVVSRTRSWAPGGSAEVAQPANNTASANASKAMTRLLISAPSESIDCDESIHRCQRKISAPQANMQMLAATVGLRNAPAARELPPTGEGVQYRRCAHSLPPKRQRRFPAPRPFSLHTTTAQRIQWN